MDGCLVVNKDPDGIRACVVWIHGPLSSISDYLQDTEEFTVAYFEVPSQVSSCLEVVVVCMNCN